MLNCSSTVIKIPKLAKVAALINYNILKTYKQAGADLKAHAQTILEAWNQVAAQSLGLFSTNNNELYLAGC